MKRRLEKSVLDKLSASSIWSNEIEPDCRKQDVLLTIRDNRFDMYHNGGKLFRFDNNGFKTHLKYASVITESGKDYLGESELKVCKLASDFETNYKRIKENCSNYSGVEASGVSKIYHNHSYLSNSNVVVLDVEVSFKSLNEDKKQDRIDILLYNIETGILQFVEAKHFSNGEIWSNTTPDVLNQIKRYESQIKTRKEDILSQYVEYVRIINGLFHMLLPEPVEIEDKVTLLIFGFDNDQKKGRLKKLIEENSEYSGTKYYSIGDIRGIVPETLWKAKTL